MVAYIVRRILLAITTLFAISVLSYIIIQLPPGDCTTSYIAQMAGSGSLVSQEEARICERFTALTSRSMSSTCAG